MLLVSAADTAVVTAATAAYAGYEKQMLGLKSQAAVLGLQQDKLSKTTGASDKIFKDYTRTVAGLRKEFPTTTAAAAQLVQTLSKFTMGGKSSNTTTLSGLAQTFYKAQEATGEDANAIATSMLTLQKQMGTSTLYTKDYTDQVVTLASKTGTSVTALTDFAGALAPIGKAAGLTQTQVMGVSTAFARAGADGGAASTAFNKILSDISYAVQTGSPDLAKYSNLVGMTASSFKDLGAGEGALRVFEGLNKQGPQAIQSLNKMGLDGMRTMTSITAVANQQGGLRGGIAEAGVAFGNGATDAGGDAGASGLANSMAKFTDQMKMFTESIGSAFAPAMNVFVTAMGKGMAIVNSFMSGPAGTLMKWALAIAAPFVALGGALMIAAPLLMKIASVAMITRSSAFIGMKQGFTGRPPTDAAQGITQRGNFISKGLYGGGVTAGEAARRAAMVGGMSAPTGAAPMPLRDKLWRTTIGGTRYGTSQGVAAPGGVSRASWMAGAPLRLAGGAMRMGATFYDPLIHKSPADRSTLFKQASLSQFKEESKAAGLSRWKAFKAYGAAGLGMDDSKVANVATTGTTGVTGSGAAPTSGAHAGAPLFMSGAGQGMTKAEAEAAAHAATGQTAAERRAATSRVVMGHDTPGPDPMQKKIDAAQQPKGSTAQTGVMHGPATQKEAAALAKAEAALAKETTVLTKAEQLAAREATVMAETTGAVNKQLLGANAGLKSLTTGALAAAKAVTASGAAAAGSALKTAGSGAALGMAGMARGAGAAMMGNPLMTAMMALMILPPAIGFIKGKMHPDDETEYKFDAEAVSNTGGYAQSAGQAPTVYKDDEGEAYTPTTASTRGDAMEVDATEKDYVTGSEYQYVNDSISKYDDYESWKRSQMTGMSYSSGLNNEAREAMVNDTTAQFGMEAGADLAQSLGDKKNYKVDIAGTFGDAQGATNEDAGTIISDLSANLAGRRGAAAGSSEELGYAENTAQLAGFTALAGTAQSEDDIGKLNDLINDSKITGSEDINLKDITEYKKASAGKDYAVAEGLYIDRPDSLEAPAGVTDPQVRVDTLTKDQLVESVMQGVFRGDDYTNAQFHELQDKLGLERDSKSDEVIKALQDSPLVMGQLDTYKATKTNLENTLEGSGQEDIAASRAVVKATTSASGDTNAQYKAILQMTSQLRQSGLTPIAELDPKAAAAAAKAGADTGGKKMAWGDVAGQAQEWSNRRGEDTDDAYNLYQGVISIATQNVQNKAPYQTGAQNYTDQTDLIQGQLGAIDSTTPNGMKTTLDLQQQQVALDASQAEKYKSIAMAGIEMDVQQRRAKIDFATQLSRSDEQFALSKERAEEDFHLQQKYSLADYTLARAQAQFDFDLQRQRSEENFVRQQKRGVYDYTLSRKRQEEDYQHSVLMMAENAAKSAMDIYTRVTVQRTTSASSLMANAKDQLATMEGQSHDLGALRQTGISDDVIQQMGLTDPKNAQQLSRFLQEILDNPSLVKQFNENIKKRIKAAGDVVTDQSSMDWQEFSRQYHLARDRGATDFARAMKLARKDFQRNMDQAEEDFKRGLKRQQKQYDTMVERQNDQFATSMERQEHDYAVSVSQMTDDFHKQMTRAANDLNRMAKDISMKMPEIMVTAMHYLKGKSREQATEVIEGWTNLRIKSGEIGQQTADHLGKIFGIDFGKVTTTWQDHAQAEAATGGNPGGGGSHGTTSTTGRRPRGGHARSGRGSEDDGSGAEVIFMPVSMPPATIGREFGFYDPQYATDHHTGQDFPTPIGSDIYAVMGGEVTMAAYDGAYGNHTRIYHGDDDQGRSVETWYAHQESQRVGVGDEPEGGNAIGKVGVTGNTSGPHLHFEYRVDGSATDPMSLLGLDATNIEEGTAPGSDTGEPAFNLKKFKKRIYKSLEEVAGKQKFMGGMPEGHMSGLMNASAIAMLKKYARKNDQTFTQLIASTASTTGGSANAAVPAGPGAKGVWDAMLSTGFFTKEQIAGIMGNMQSESGFNPYIVQGGGTSMDPSAAGSGGYGLVQWTPGSKLIPLLHGEDPSVATEIDALVEQLRGVESYAWGQVAATKSVADAARVFESAYERPASTGDAPTRIAQAEAIYAKYAAHGSIFNGGAQNVVVGERGPEVVLPLDHNGVNFITELMTRMSPGSEARGIYGHNTPVNQSTQHYDYKIDRSHKFSGPITVQANDTHSFLHQLKQMQRRGALGQPGMNSSVYIPPGGVPAGAMIK